MKRLSDASIDWWRRRGWTDPRLPQAVRVAAHSELPETIARRRLVIVGAPPAWAVFECPCGSGHQIKVRIAPHAKVPTWTLTHDVDGPTLRPSIDSTVNGRRCHFWLRNGRVEWV